MDNAMHDKGLAIRRAVLGDAYVDNAMKNVDAFNQPLQDLLNEYCWGAIWGREGLPRKTRSMLNLAMISVLNRPHELRAHLRGALNNGLTKDEIGEIFLQVAVYAGRPGGGRFLPCRARILCRDGQEGLTVISSGCIACASGRCRFPSGCGTAGHRVFI
jgi:4-carboxymuconolactone decarboxylase